MLVEDVKVIGGEEFTPHHKLLVYDMLLKICKSKEKCECNEKESTGNEGVKYYR